MGNTQVVLRDSLTSLQVNYNLFDNRTCMIQLKKVPCSFYSYFYPLFYFQLKVPKKNDSNKNRRTHSG